MISWTDWAIYWGSCCPGKMTRRDEPSNTTPSHSTDNQHTLQQQQQLILYRWVSLASCSHWYFTLFTLTPAISDLLQHLSNASTPHGSSAASPGSLTAGNAVIFSEACDNNNTPTTPSCWLLLLLLLLVVWLMVVMMVMVVTVRVFSGFIIFFCNIFGFCSCCIWKWSHIKTVVYSGNVWVYGMYNEIFTESYR